MDYLGEVVELKRRTAEGGAHLLTVDESNVLPAELKGSPVITVKWRDRTHLEIGYRAGEIDHQVSKVADVFVETQRMAGQV